MSKAAVGRYLTAFVWHALEGAAAELGVPLSALDHPAPESSRATPIRGRKRS